VSASTPARVVAVLGTGTMGAPMARNLLRAGLEVRAWNRNRARAQVLAQAGAHVADTPAEAVDGAEVIVTMLADGDAVIASMEGADGALSAIAPEAV